MISKTAKKPESTAEDSEIKTKSGKTYTKIENLNRASPERLQAILLLNRINYFGYYNKDTSTFIYTTNAKNEVDDFFQSYCTRVSSEKIVLTRAPDGDPVFSQDLIINYKTRFTDQARQQDNINGFRSSYRTLLKRHLKGVFLTLTAPYNPAKTLWGANKSILQAWGKMKDFFNSVLPNRCDWICVREFQKNGRLHFHILIGGTNWLASKKLLQYTWMKYGGGPILDIHSIHHEPGRGWLWSRSRPSEAEGQQPEDMLESYLEKSMSREGGALYWAMGCRNWTCSKSLLPKKETETVKSKNNNENLQKQEEITKQVKPSNKKYFLKGIISKITGFRASHRSDSVSLFSGSLTTKKRNSVSVSGTKIKEKEKPSISFRRATDLFMQG
ncbi:rolling circle replication-associated protein [Methanosarcina horonobensis]|nr:hypothetical protein [Methanosarcina horonobensis]